jgi:type II secretory pathway predicted ATPase ExeA
MFLEYYGLKEHPFGVTPDPRFLFHSATHREALASLLVGIKANRGFLALVAPPGMGKTTLLFHLMKNLEPNARTVFLFQTQCNSVELLRYILTDMGIETNGQDVVKMHAQLNEALAANAQAGKQFVLIIDEAQNLSPEVLETVRLLSDFETPRSKLMQIILAGQTQLTEKLAHPGLAQLSQRISIFSRLTPFNAEETADYISHRLQTAGYTGPRLFSPAALGLIAKYSKGIPRNINNLCFNALSWGCAMKKRLIDAEIVEEVGAELAVNMIGQAGSSRPSQLKRIIPALSFAPSSRVASRRLTLGITATAALLLLAVAFALRPPRNQLPAVARVPSSTPVTPADPPRNIRIDVASTAPPPASPSHALISRTNMSDAAMPEANGQAIVVVEPNQSLWTISRRYFGSSDPSVIKQIWQLNTSIANPNHIEVGQRIRLPRIRGTPEAVSTAYPDLNGSETKGGHQP